MANGNHQLHSNEYVSSFLPVSTFLILPSLKHAGADRYVIVWARGRIWNQNLTLDFYICILYLHGDFKNECSVTALDVNSFFRRSLKTIRLFLLQMTSALAVGGAIELRVWVHTFTFAAPVPLALINEPVVDLLQIQAADSLQVM